MGCEYGLSSWWQLIDDAYVKVAVEGHGKGTWYGGCRHHQNMGRILALRPKLCTLRYTKTVLLIYDNKAETCKLNGVFNNGMCANKDMDCAIEKSLKYFFAPLALDDAR